MASFYFITFILISAFVMLSLFIGAVTMSMTQSMEHMKKTQEEAEAKVRIEKARKRALEAEQRAREAAKKRAEGEKEGNSLDLNKNGKLSAAERRERQKMREVLMQTWDDCDLTDILTQQQGDTKSLKGAYLKIAALATKIVEHPKFALFVTGVICLAGLMVGLQTSPEVLDVLGALLNGLDTAILAVFTAEVILKILAEGLEPWEYFRTPWNVFDFVIVVGSFARGKGGMLTMLRLLRLLRVLKLVRAFPQLQVIVSALIKGVGSIGYIGLILFLCFYVFGIVGNMLFSNNDPFHFQYLHFAMITLFQLSTMDGWSDVLYINYYGCDLYGYDSYRALGYDCQPHAYGFIAVLYFCSFIVLGGMVLITLFVGVVTTSMEEATQEMAAEKELLRRVEALRVQRNIDPSVVTSYMQVFRMLDLDESGSVEEAELRTGLAAIGKYPSYEELKEMMDVVDEDGSGQIDIVEFVEFMIHLQKGLVHLMVQ
ncbi:Voltage-gated Ion Channel (VIC) Superfamily [Phytophthora cinnamomi]|uniref:Voltage-gated Ion Channel (VIC) Superfamily n=1 Tax=Phytophthora cinnamomi TaxID=4785 RepID=UPI003559F2A7|nr:Voltage-gated Ion Channel (VIC) Superfamily [Phytophthora cinnamomi]